MTRLRLFATISASLALFVGSTVPCYAGYCSRDNEDQWYRALPATLQPFDTKWQRVLFVARVLDSKQVIAQAQLVHAAFVAISPTDAEAMVGEQIPASSQTYFLLRALEYPKRPGQFHVRELHGMVSVTFATLGDTPARAERAAIVARLDREPADVFVGCDSSI